MHDAGLAPHAVGLDLNFKPLRFRRQTNTLVVNGDVHHLPFPDTLPEWLSPLVDIIPAQLFTAALARAKGLDVERPRGLKKVTLTS